MKRSARELRRCWNRRSARSTLLHRVVSAPTETHDTGEDLVTYSFRAEPVHFQEMFDRLEVSHFNGHYTKVIRINSIAVL